MKRYAVTIADRDCPWGEAIKFTAASKTEARRIARDYIRAWGLVAAKVVSITEIEKNAA